MKNTIVALSGGFDPIHSGHIAMIQEACEIGDYVIIGLNSDEWLSRKKGRSFMPYDERATVLEAMRGVSRVMRFDDTDDTACDFLLKLKDQYRSSRIIFANGGDRTENNIPEMSVTGIEFKFFIGGEKTASSSDFLGRWLDTCSKAA